MVSLFYNNFNSKGHRGKWISDWPLIDAEKPVSPDG